MPDDRLSVLICQEGDQDSVELAYYDSELDLWSDIYGNDLDDPTHWADVPEVPMAPMANEKGVGA